jgi:hypothetical protein
VTSAGPRGVSRPLLHPLAPAVGLAVLALTGAALHGTAAAGLLLAATAGYAAGFANSGST